MKIDNSNAYITDFVYLRRLKIKEPHTRRKIFSEQSADILKFLAVLVPKIPFLARLFLPELFACHATLEKYFSMKILEISF